MKAREVGAAGQHRGECGRVNLQVRNKIVKKEKNGANDREEEMKRLIFFDRA